MYVPVPFNDILMYTILIGLLYNLGQKDDLS